MIDLSSLEEVIPEADKVLGLSKEDLISFLVQGAVRAYKASSESQQSEDVGAEWQSTNSTLSVFVKRRIVETVKNPAAEISTAQAKTLKSSGALGDMVKVPVSSEMEDSVMAACRLLLGQISQAVSQKNQNFLEGKLGELCGKCLTGTVKSNSAGSVSVSIAGVDVILPGNEQLGREQYDPGSQLTVYIKGYEPGVAGGKVIGSRRAPELVTFVLRKYVPEIAADVVLVKAVARLPGKKSRAAVYAADPNIDAVEKCKGKGSKLLKTMSKALGGEELDLVQWHSNQSEFIASALNAQVGELVFLDSQKKVKVNLMKNTKDPADLAEDLVLAEQLLGLEIELL